MLTGVLMKAANKVESCLADPLLGPTYTDAVRKSAEASVQQMDLTLARLGRNPDQPAVTEEDLKGIRQERRADAMKTKTEQVI